MVIAMGMTCCVISLFVVVGVGPILVTALGIGAIASSLTIRSSSPEPSRGRFPEDVQKEDPFFSGELFRDFAHLAYTRAVALAHDSEGRGLLRTLLSDEAGAELERSLGDGPVRGLVTVGHLEVEVQESIGRDLLKVRYLANITQADGTMLDRDEVWFFARPAGSRSPEPERMRSLSCAACGSTEAPGLSGACPSCGQPRTEGSPQWRVVQVSVTRSEPVQPIETVLTAAGEGREVGLDHPTVKHPQLRSQQEAFESRHPQVDLASELQRLSRMFVLIQAAWSRDRWGEARPLMSDALFTANQGWLEQLRRQGMVNRVADVRVSRVELCRVEADAWVETLTIRIFAECFDWTETLADRAVVGGSKTEVRVFSEYWTFVRNIGARRASENLAACPSCGASLDRMGMAGVCGYCNSKVSQGRFDWVVCRIGQDEDVAS